MTDQETISPLPLEIGSPAPLFEARSTHGVVRLEDYRGRWVLLFSHPADFTPVCTSEFLTFADRIDDFAKMECVLLGLSVDSIYAHLAWLKDIDEKFGRKVGFPLIEDVSMSISRAYGMVHDRSSGTATVRSVYFIDPQGVIRSIMHYPANVGRSVDELLRVLAGLREADAEGVFLPEGWKPGETTILPAPTTMDELESRDGHYPDTYSWYFKPSEEDGTP